MLETVQRIVRPSFSPALIGLEPKSRFNPSAVEDSIRRACFAARGIPRVMPVMHEGKPVALVRGRSWWEDDPEAVYWRRWSPPLRCTITTYDLLIAAMTGGKLYRSFFSKNSTTNPVANNWMDLWPVGGFPTVGTYPGAAATAVQKSDADVGAMLHGGNVSSSVKNIVSAYATSSATFPTIMLYDRVLTYDASTITNGAVAFTNVLAAQRYASGAPGLLVCTTCQTVLGSTASYYTVLQYTDDAGNASQSAPVNLAATSSIIISAAAPSTTLGARVVFPSANAATVPLGPFMPLAAGDNGVRLLSTRTMSAANTGTLCYVLMHPLAIVPIQAATVTCMIDTVMQLAGMEIIYDGACVSALGFWPAATGAVVSGAFSAAWG